jgi:hypothetical protein
MDTLTFFLIGLIVLASALALPTIIADARKNRHQK